MITQEHLEHWLKEINYQLTGIQNELGRSVGVSKGISLNDKLYISFEYLIEKATTIKGVIQCIEEDIQND